MRKAISMTATGLMLLAPCAPAAGQAVGADGRIVYEPAFFATFAPANALQIVERTPGFTLEIADQEVRGFAQAAGNVVINGQRPSSKSDTLDTILQRIPANRVLRVEVARGDLFGAEFAGKAQVLNLILTESSGIAGTFTGTVRREYTGRLLPEGSTSILAKRGASTFNAALTFDNNTTTEEGFDRVTALPGDALLEYRRKTNMTRDPQGAISAGWAYDGGTNRTAHVNVRAATGRFRLTQANAVFPAIGPDRDDRLTQRYRTDTYEIGGDITRPLAGGGLKLVALATRRDRLFGDAQLLRVGGDTIGGFTQTLADDRDETVARLVWSRAGWNGWSVETGVEGALNRLASNVDLSALGAGGTATPIDLPVDRAIVTEYRGEAFVNAGRALAANLRVDLGVTVETSRLTVRGDAEADRALTFVKPRVTLDWQPGDKWRTQLSLRRTVAQLQFEDFISVAELSNDRVNGGNANLLPQRAWEALLTVQRPILGTGLFKLEAGYNRIALVQDRVPTPEGFDAPGNLGDGTTRILRATLDTPLDRAGIKGGRITLYASYVGTAVRDPYTQDLRRFSGTSPFVFEASLRQDRGRFAWGLTAFGQTASTFYRRDETDRSQLTIPYLTAFAEYRATPRTILTLTVDNLTDVAAARTRTFYSPDRTTPDADMLEYRKRYQHVTPILTLKHSFG